MGGKSDFLNEANKIVTEFEKNEKQKQYRDTCIATYQKNNEFYQKIKSEKLHSITQTELIERYNKTVNRFFYLAITIASFTAIMILCKICL